MCSKVDGIERADDDEQEKEEEEDDEEKKNYSAALFSLNLMRNRGMMKQSRVSESEGMA